MSYILDALQRADAERARGGVPTLHARPLAGAPLPQRMGTPQRWGLAIAVGVVLIGIAVASWWMWRAAPTTFVAAVLPVPVAPSVLAPLPPSVALTMPLPTRPTVVATKPPPAKVKTVASSLEPAPPKAKASAMAKASAPSAPQPAPATAPALAPLLSELPEATRRQIPTMTISGAVYSENPAQRLLLVNGLVLNQGSQVAPDLTVVEIHSNNSEFNFRGTRFRMAH
ncbi:MAG: general secretion pathway protein GspB [Rhodoferax sp.]